MRQRQPGWYADPVTSGAFRYVDETGWTSWVSWHGNVFADPTPIDSVRATAARVDAAVVDGYVEDAVERHVFDDVVARVIRHDLELWPARAAAAPPVATPAPPPAPVARPRATSAALNKVIERPAGHTPAVHPAAGTDRPAVDRPAPVPAARFRHLDELEEPHVEYTPPTPIASAEPGALATWWSRTRTTVVSDLAVHGLAYLGVALLFVGVFGLVAFSSGDVAPAWRGVADVSAPSAFFLAAWFLRRRRATAVATALTLLGGAVLPVVAVASVTDNSSVPPDAHGTALPVVHAVLCAVIAGAIWWWSRRNPTTPLRWVMAPTAWMGAGLLAALARDTIPSGEDVVRADSTQLAVMVAAVAVTLLVVRRDERPLARAVRATALPTALGLAIIEAFVAGFAGWPVVGGVVVAVAGLVVAECATRLPGAWVPIVQGALIGVGTARLAPEVRPAWLALGALVGLGMVVEWSGRRTDRHPGVALPILGALVAATGTTLETVPGVAGLGLVGAWALWRRATRPPWLLVHDEAGVLPALSSFGLWALLWRATEPSTALWVAGGVVVAVAVAGHVWRSWQRDALWRWWVPTVAAAAAVATSAIPWHSDRWVVAAVSALAAAALVLSSALPVAARTWSASLAVGWSALAIGEAFGLGRTADAVTAASVAFALVVAASVVDRTVWRHLGGVGHVLGVGAVFVPLDAGWATTVALGLLAGSWWAVTWIDDRGRAAHLQRAAETLGDEGGWLRTAPPVLASIVTTLAAVFALEASGTVHFGSVWVATPFAAGGAVVAWMSLLRWRRAEGAVLAGLGLSMGAVALIAPATFDLARWPLVVALAAWLVTSMATVRRWPLVAWSTWAATAPLAVLLVEAAGLSRRWSDLAFAAWGAVLLLATAAVDRVRHGSARPDQWMRDTWATPPATLGAAAVVVGAWGGMAFESVRVCGWIALAVAGVAMAVAAIRPLAVLSAAPAVLVTLGVPAVVSWSFVEHPWSFACWALVLAGVAWAVQPRMEVHWARRWDLPPFIVAHGVAALAAGLAFRWDSVTITLLPLAAGAFAVAAVRRRVEWLLGGAVLLLIAAGAAGEGWFALAWLGVAVATTWVAVRSDHGVLRDALLLAGALSTSAAWACCTLWLGLSASAVTWTTGTGSALVVLVAAVAFRTRRVPDDVTAVWAGVASAGVLAASLMLRQPDVATWAWGLVALDVAVVGVASAVASGGATGQRAVLLRWTSPALIGTALLMVRAAADVSGPDTAVWATCLAMAVAFGVVLLHAVRVTSVWRMPWLGFMVVTQAVGLGLTVEAEPFSVAIAVAALLAMACETAAVAIAIDEPYVYVAAPPFALVAWFVVATQSLHGDPNWYTLPLGVTMIVMVSLVRWVRGSRPGAVRSESVRSFVVAMEVVAVALMAGPPLVQTVAVQLWYGLLAAGIGCCVALWGAVGHVRRRAGMGVITIAAALVALVAVPIVRTVPELRGPALWLTLAGVGAAAIVVASLLEQGRATVRHLADLLDETTREWEHSDAADTAPTRRDDGGAGSSEEVRPVTSRT